MAAGRTRRKPHTQIGQKGKGTGRPKGPGAGGGQTTGLPIQVGQFPKAPPQIPNFLPMTTGFVRGQSQVNDAMSAAGNAFGNATGMIGPQLDLQRARLGTDMDVATDRLKENLAERGVYTPGASPAGGGIGESLYGRQIATPFGRQYQDLAAGAAGAYTDAASQYGGAQLGGAQDMFDLYNQRASDAFDLGSLGFPVGGYNLPHQPGPRLTTTRGGGGGGGRTRRKNRRK